ncbi:MAG TPA: cytochrome c-type biogenesis protein CcmH [Vicinamibacterales bacterium]|nr:cytochrome c-type biogenesis protein CcmH [Vicinamibacterales bacterium]
MSWSNLVLVALLTAAPPLSGPALETEARQIETMLIAPCCWNQQVSEHQSPASDEVKKEVRAMLAAGASRQEVLDSFAARYGNRILAEPPAVGFTRFLYVLPWVFFGGSAIGLTFLVRRMSARRPAPEPSAANPAAAQAAQSDYEQRLDDELRDLD